MKDRKKELRTFVEILAHMQSEPKEQHEEIVRQGIKNLTREQRLQLRAIVDALTEPDPGLE